MSYLRNYQKGFPDAVSRCIWLAGYLMKYHELRSDEAKQRLGIATRTLRRDINRLRDAGFIVEGYGPRGYRFRSFDPTRSELVRERYGT